MTRRGNLTARTDGRRTDGQRMAIY